MASSESTPLAARPSPRRTMREKASTTRNPEPAGCATKSRQLFVPRSSAAYCGAKRCAEACGRGAGLKSDACGRPAGNPAEIDFPLVPATPGTNAASAGAPAHPDGGLVPSGVPSGFSTASNPSSSKHDLLSYRNPDDESKPQKSHISARHHGNPKPY